ncbi:MAG: hypothetical protein ACOVOT_01745 [Rubrivivax sp.]|jgi:hypothetical protein
MKLRNLLPWLTWVGPVKRNVKALTDSPMALVPPADGNPGPRA